MENPFYDYSCGSSSVENVLMSVNELFPFQEVYDKPLQKDDDFLNINYFEIDLERMLLTLKHPATLYFTGSFYVECLCGAVDVHGYTLKPNCGPYLVVSGFGQSAMCFSSIADREIGIDEVELELTERKILKPLQDQFSQIFSATCVLILSKTDDRDVPIRNVFKLEKFQCFEIPRSTSFSYFEKLENWLGCMFDFNSGCRIPQKMKFDESLRNLAGDCFHWEDPRVIICGGKGVGKSTSLQYLVNRMFEKWSGVVVIDFDIGQPEFSIPGCISVTLVQKPILCPYFNNMCEPLRSIVVGHINLDMCLTKYFAAVEELHRYCSLNEDILRFPWIINTMGYIKGFGLPVIAKINFLFNPTHILQINSSTEPSLNVLPLTPKNVHEMLEFSILHNSFPLFDNDFRIADNYSLISLPAQKLKNAVFIPPRVSREIRVISYMILNGLSSESLIISMTLEHKSQKEIRYYNRNKVVAICTPYCKRSFMQCVGYGIILERAGDKITFQTPLKEDIFLNETDLDIFVLELGLRNSSWDGISLSYPDDKEYEKVVLLRNNLGNFDFLF
ncbi:polynucleotide 5'-hydroxyl-kinase NOL9 [Halyomorpha halys]|uniref:polynucleotide 5'-hydroxyl-kinase NOL9 n=1 Tax=Halyomorpha halys TaxID=286706 RepID=UPI0006D51E4D|nr:polynucleotide 5'-hydroxyl-kinase NOL9 [Halyomorpha halys]